MHLNATIGLGLLVTLFAMTMMAAMDGNVAPVDTPQSANCPVAAMLPLAPVTIDVPANGAVTFGVADLVAAAPEAAQCLDMAAIDASSFVAHAAEGRVSIVADTPARTAGWSATSLTAPLQRFVFTPMPNFRGVSQGWEFVVMGHDEAGEPVRIGIVRATFEVRNGVPVAEDDAVAVAPRLGGIEVGADHGVLANDRDPNRDPLVVHSAGIAAYPWGTVEIHHDGSYRVRVTDPEVSGTAEVRYVVWDGAGSTSGADTGILTVTFDEDSVASHQLLFASNADGARGVT